MYFNNRGINPDTQTSFNSFNEDYSAVDSATELNPQPVNEDFAMHGVIDEGFMMESAIVQQVERMDDQTRANYLNSDEFQALVEAGVVGRRAIVRMSRQADMDRRIHLLALQMAKEGGDADWEALRQNRIRERKLLNKIYQKYGQRVQRQAAMSQKRLIKLSPRAFDLTAPMR